MSAEILVGDCRDVLALLLANASIDAIVTDPPYELGFMGKHWDRQGIAYDVTLWREALRVLKPGGHLLAFGGSRTYHRLACTIEDAGFQIRDQIMWLYGSGFPKSLDVSKAIDKAAGAKREQIAPRSVINRQRQIGNHRPYMDDPNHTTDSDIPATAAAAAWQGWGTALKPAHEPIVVARKPLLGSVADNVMTHGVGGLNIDGCRVGTDGGCAGAGAGAGARVYGDSLNGSFAQPVLGLGRWPANVIHDGSAEVLAGFPSSKSGTQTKPLGTGGIWSSESNHPCGPQYGDSGSAARFFYCAKASKADRGEANHHPTVKPIDLMRYLCRLVTPPGGLILDPFAGSGSTGKAAILEGFHVILIEAEAAYIPIIKARMAHAESAVR